MPLKIFVSSYIREHRFFGACVYYTHIQNEIKLSNCQWKKEVKYVLNSVKKFAGDFDIYRLHIWFKSLLLVWDKSLGSVWETDQLNLRNCMIPYWDKCFTCYHSDRHTKWCCLGRARGSGLSLWPISPPSIHHINTNIKRSIPAYSIQQLFWM